VAPPEDGRWSGGQFKPPASAALLRWSKYSARCSAAAQALSGGPAEGETGHGGCLRACEYVRGARKKCDPERGSASRADVSFEFDACGEPISCCVMVANSKARGAERFRRLPHYLPMDAGYLSPGRMLYFLAEVADRVPLDQRRITPLFRDPATSQQITIATLRPRRERSWARMKRISSTPESGVRRRISSMSASAERNRCALPLSPVAPMSMTLRMSFWPSSKILFLW
jgi:hypothetical protein